MAEAAAAEPATRRPLGPCEVGPGRALALHDAARLLGGYRWVEHRLFELTGGWASDAADPAVQLHLNEVSGQHAWHAELLADRLPVLAGIDPEALSVPDGPTAGPLLQALSEVGCPTGPDDHGADLRRLGGLYRVVVPRLLVTYDRHLRRAVAVTDGPLIRALRLVRADEVESWLAGESLLQSAVSTPAAVETVAHVQRALECLCGDTPGGLAGWPAPVS